MHELVEVDRHLPDHVDEIGPDTHKAAGYLWGDVHRYYARWRIAVGLGYHRIIRNSSCFKEFVLS